MPLKQNKKLFVIDGNSFCYRAFYAIKHLSNSKGQATNAVYGVVTMINKLIKEEAPDMIAVAFDVKGPTFRHKRYEKYKITRKPMPDELAGQMNYIKKLIRAYRIPIYELEGYEADDVLGTIVKKVRAKEIVTFLVTGDKDAMQLVGPHVKVYNTHAGGEIYGEEEVMERFGVGPGQIVDLMALMGDSSDNIPGIPGIGEKTAIELMQEFGSLDEVLNNTNKMKSESRRKRIDQSREMAILSKELATIKMDVPIELDFDGLVVKSPDREALLELFTELEFRNLSKDLAPKRRCEGVYKLVNSEKDFREMLRALKEKERFAFDFETTHYDPMLAEPIGISFCWDEGKAFYVPFNALTDMSVSDVLKALKPVFEDEKIKKIGQNIKYDMLILQNKGIVVQGVEFDTMIASYLLDPSRSRHNLADIALEHLGRTIGSFEDLVGKGKNAITMDAVEVRKVCDYCCEDSDVTFSLAGIMRKKLREKALSELFEKVEVPLIRVLARMEAWGVSVDTGYLKALSLSIAKDIKKLEEIIYKLAGEEFNVNSPKQLRVILFEKLKLPVVKRTKTGASTNEEVLKILSKKHDLPKEILAFRELAKLKSTYVDNVPGLINGRTGRIHTSFNQAVTATGRLSSSKPNLQNIPIKTPMGKKIRKAFIAEKKSQKLLSADYSQIELRVLAHLSGDENLIKAFREDRDIHAFTASLIYGTEEKDVSSAMRNTAKTVNFGIIYGMSAYGLSRDLGISVQEAAKFIEAYFERYPRIKDYLQSQIDAAAKNGFVKTIMGRRRYIPEITSSNAQMRSFAERTAVNAPIQGSAADLIKLATININDSLDEFRAKMILQVHDELVFEVEKSVLSAFAGRVKDAMEGVYELAVPIKVGLEAGDNWLELEKVEL